MNVLIYLVVINGYLWIYQVFKRLIYFVKFDILLTKIPYEITFEVIVINNLGDINSYKSYFLIVYLLNIIYIAMNYLTTYTSMYIYRIYIYIKYAKSLCSNKSYKHCIIYSENNITGNFVFNFLNYWITSSFSVHDFLQNKYIFL